LFIKDRPPGSYAKLYRMRMLHGGLSAIAALALSVVPSAAQSFDTVGTRAAGMGGAFVAVADDASAVYWNPAGFASGALLSFVLDRNTAEMDTPNDGAAASRSGFLMALGIPAVGLSYYRLRSIDLKPLQTLAGPAVVEANSLVTHHIGATLVQSLLPGVAVGATLKLVRGVASSTQQPATERDDLLDDHGDLTAEGSTRFDADLGIMTTFGRLKAGLTVRNVSEPAFRTPGGRSLHLERQARAGISVAPVEGWVVAADSDVLESDGPAGPLRRFAAGTEGRVHRKALVRGGVSVNTAGERAPAVSAGVSFAATASFLVDVQVTGGSDKTARGWGVAARFGY
jgi:hypothetical protein